MSCRQKRWGDELRGKGEGKVVERFAHCAQRVRPSESRGPRADWRERCQRTTLLMAFIVRPGLSPAFRDRCAVTPRLHPPPAGLMIANTRTRVLASRVAPLTALFLAGVPVERPVERSPAPAAQRVPVPVVGRWDVVVRTPEGDRPSWFEIRRSGTNTLVGQYVGIVGSARPISRVTYENGALRFSVPPQWEGGPNDISFEGRLEGDRLTGSMTGGDGKRVEWTAKRAPTLRRQAAPAWGARARLLNGRDLAGWHVVGGDNQWQMVGGILHNTKSGGNLVTDATYTDFKLHVEFRYPAAGNSGVYLRGRHEVQVEDTPGPEPAIDGFGAVYGFLTPSELVAKKPGEWQSYDITLVGRKITLVANGKTILCEQEIPGITGGALDSDEGAPGPIMLQGDHTAVEYRNITISKAR